MKKVVVTVIGEDRVGIVAGVSGELSKENMNILDISQTIVDGFFNMMMIVDVADSKKEFGVMVDELEKLGEDMGCIVKAQREDIFDKMHRL